MVHRAVVCALWVSAPLAWTACEGEESGQRASLPNSFFDDSSAADSSAGDQDSAGGTVGPDGDVGAALECLTDGECDDANPCTQNVCSDGACETLATDGPCDDGDVCTSGDHCVGGDCAAGSQPPCDDANPCTQDLCLDTGCAHTPVDAGCEDGNPCTKNDFCIDGSCLGGEPAPCESAGDCWQGVCLQNLGCVQEPRVGGPCDDGDPCTTDEKCESGFCRGGVTTDCDDGNSCTVDICAVVGCVHTPSAGPCDDGSTCTTGDTCVDGGCVGIVTKECNDGNPCTTDKCSGPSGCVFTNNLLACEDGNACSVGDHCGAGACQPGEALVCDDGNECTDDVCNEALGCVSIPNAEECNDGDPCTLQAACVDGACEAVEVVDCDDENPCTVDVCDAEGDCSHTFDPGPCDDGNACTQGEACSSGACGGGLTVLCDDGNKCTADMCVPATGCVFANAPAGTKCNDGTVCTTVDACAAGVCKGLAPLDCDDGNPCTADGCDPVLGCTHSNADGVCEDGNACTTGDTCAAGICNSGGAAHCDDGNACTTDTCTAAGGCQHASLSGAPCDDGDACTPNDACVLGTCLSSGAASCNDGNPCTTDSCDSEQGCVHAPNGLPCNDGELCTANDTCAGGSCGGTPVECIQPGGACAVASCQPGVGCVTKQLVGACDDGDDCTVGDACQGSACVPGPSMCDDGIACTNDVCAAGGCDHVASDVACDDGNPCTSDTCGEDGCIHITILGSCDDGDVCTTGDHCAAGDCIGEPVDCNDGMECTQDVCDMVQGCIYLNVPGDCDDGQPCTVGDECVDGDCVSGQQTDCDDGVACTVDSCTPSGCKHVVAPSRCYIGGECYMSGDKDPIFGCGTCDSTKSKTGWIITSSAECDLLYQCGWLQGLSAAAAWPTAGFCAARAYHSPRAVVVPNAAYASPDLTGTIQSEPTLGDGFAIVTTDQGWIYRINAGGQIAWSVRYAGAARGATISADGAIWIATSGGHLHALDPTTGDSLLGVLLSSGALQAPAIFGDTVVVTTQAAVTAAYDLGGNPLWLYAMASPASAPLAIGAYGTVYVGTSGGITYGLNVANGSWKFQQTDPGAIHRVAVGSDGGVLTQYGGATSGVRVRESGGATRWSSSLQGDLRPPAFRGDGTVWLFGADHSVVGYDWVTGADVSLGAWALPGAVAGGAWDGSDTLVVAAASGRVAFGPAPGFEYDVGDTILFPPALAGEDGLWLAMEDYVLHLRTSE